MDKSNNMRSLLCHLLIFTMLFFVTSCNFNYSKSGLKATDFKEEFCLAKRSIGLIKGNNPDSLRAMFNSKAGRGIGKEQMNWLMKESQNILRNYQYPDDSLVTVNETNNNSAAGTISYREFVFPFEQEDNKDSTKYLKITIANNQLQKFLIGSGFQFMR